MSSTEMKKRKREEYEMQLFGFHSRAVYATLKSLLQEKISSRCHKLCDSLVKKYKPDDESLQMIERNRRKLAKAYYLGCKTHLPTIENLVNNLIGIPQHVLLEEDIVQAKQYTEDEYNEMTMNMKNLQQRLQRATIMNAKLKEELIIAELFENNINTATTLCTVTIDGSKYSEVNNTMVKLVENYKDLEENFPEVKCSDETIADFNLIRNDMKI